MNSNPMISVIMSVYNREDYVSDCIKSVLNQSFSNFEFIIVDDASIDSTVDIINSFNDPRIILIKNDKNIGLTKNLNHALLIAKGKYIARMDDDDICFKNRFELQYRYLEKHKNVFLACSEAVSFGTKEELCFKSPKNNNFYRDALILRNCICHSSVMFRNNGFSYDERFLKSQDFEAWFRATVIENKIIAIINRPLIYLRIHSTQTNVSTQSEYGTMILERNYSFLFGSDFDKNVFDTHLKLIYYNPTKINETNDLVCFYEYHKNSTFCRFPLLKPVLLFEIEKYCSCNSIKNPLRKRFIFSVADFRCFKYYFLTAICKKTNTKRYTKNIYWFK